SAKREVESEGNKRSLEIVVDGGVRRILVRAIELDPRIETGIGDTLDETPRCADDRCDGPSEYLEQPGRGHDSAARKGEIVVVSRDAVEGPELARVVLARE